METKDEEPKPEKAQQAEPVKDEDEAAVEAGVVAVGTVAIWFKDLKNKFKRFWANKKLRYSTLAGIAVLLTAFFVLPLTRYGFFNVIGIRASAEIVVLDQDSNQPLRNVNVELGGASGSTDDQGVVKLSKVRLGDQTLNIKKIAYADISQKVRVGFGGNTYDSFSLEPIGTQFSFKITNWLSGQPIDHAEVSYGESSAFSNEDGVALLTTQPLDDEQIEVTVSGKNYLSMPIAIDTTSDETHQTSLVSAPKHYFISKRSGKFDIYSTNLDGSDQRVIIQGTGKETENTAFAISPDNRYGALVSTRDGNVNKDGYGLQTVYIIDLETAQLKKVDESEQIDIVDWIGSRVVYVKTTATLSGGNLDRQKLMSYNTQGGESKQLDRSNYFNDVLSAGGKIYYGKSNAFGNESEAHFMRMGPDGNDKESLVNIETYNIWRTKYDQLVISAGNKWFEHDLKIATNLQLSGQPPNLNSFIFSEGPDSKKSAWVDQRDGKGTLIVHDNNSGEDKVVVQAPGIVQPVRWIYDDLLIYRVASNTETADYIVSVNGGEPQKLSDVSDIQAITRWYYY